MLFMDYIKNVDSLRMSITKNAAIELTPHSQLKITGPIRQQNVLYLLEEIGKNKDWDDEKKAEALITLVLAVSSTTSTELKDNILKGLELNSKNIFNTKNIFLVDKLPSQNFLREYPDTYFITLNPNKIYLTPKEIPNNSEIKLQEISFNQEAFAKLIPVFAKQKKEELPTTPLNRTLTDEELKSLWQLVDKDNTIKNKFDLTGNAFEADERMNRILFNLLRLVQKVTGKKIELFHDDSSKAEKLFEKAKDRIFKSMANTLFSTPNPFHEDKKIKFENKNTNDSFIKLVDNLDAEREKTGLKVDDLLVFSNAEKLANKFQITQ